MLFYFSMIPFLEDNTQKMISETTSMIRLSYELELERLIVFPNS